MNYKKKYLKYKKKYLKSKYSGGTEENDDEYDDDFERDPDFNIKYIQEKIKNIDITNANELLTLMEKYNYTDRNIDDGIFDEFDKKTLEETLEISKKKIEPLQIIHNRLNYINDEWEGPVVIKNKSADCIIMKEKENTYEKEKKNKEDEQDEQDEDEEADEEEEADKLTRTNTLENLMDALNPDAKNVHKEESKMNYNLDEIYNTALNRNFNFDGTMLRY